jgi:hypothetical protein
MYAGKKSESESESESARDLAFEVIPVVNAVFSSLKLGENGVNGGRDDDGGAFVSIDSKEFRLVNGDDADGVI